MERKLEWQRRNKCGGLAKVETLSGEIPTIEHTIVTKGGGTSQGGGDKTHEED